MDLAKTRDTSQYSLGRREVIQGPTSSSCWSFCLLDRTLASLEDPQHPANRWGKRDEKSKEAITCPILHWSRLAMDHSQAAEPGKYRLALWAGRRLPETKHWRPWLYEFCTRTRCIFKNKCIKASTISARVFNSNKAIHFQNVLWTSLLELPLKTTCSSFLYSEPSLNKPKKDDLIYH